MALFKAIVSFGTEKFSEHLSTVSAYIQSGSYKSDSEWNLLVEHVQAFGHGAAINSHPQPFYIGAS